MLEIKEAYKKARNAEPNLDLLEGYKCDDKWIFDFREIDENGSYHQIHLVLLLANMMVRLVILQFHR